MAEFTLKKLDSGGQAGKYLIHIDGELFPLPLTPDEAAELIEKYDLQPETLADGHSCPAVCPGRCVWCHITCRGYKGYRRKIEKPAAPRAKESGANGSTYDPVRHHRDDPRRTNKNAKITRSL